MGRVPPQGRSASVRSFGRRAREVSQRTPGGILWGRSTECGGRGGQDSRRRSGARAGRRLTMCPLGRTPLIPLQLEINESLILHPLLLSPLPPPPPLSRNHEFFCRRPCRVPLWQSYWPGGHRSRRSPGTLYLPSPHNRPAAELILDFPSLSSLNPSTAPSKRQHCPPTNPVIATPPWPRHRRHTSHGRKEESAIPAMRSQVIEAGAPVSLPALTGPDKIALMGRTSTTLSREIAIWMIWTRMSGWWKSCSFLLPPLPSFLAGTPISE